MLLSTIVAESETPFSSSQMDPSFTEVADKVSKKVYVLICPRIAYRFELPTRVWLIKPDGTKFGVTLHKTDNCGYLTHGMFNILRHYCLPDGAWLKLRYMGGDQFRMRVKDLTLFEVLMKPPPTTINLECPLLPPHMFDLTTTRPTTSGTKTLCWHVRLNEEQLTNPNLMLPTKLVNQVLTVGVTKQVLLIDDQDKGVTCNIRWVPPNNQAFLGEE